MSLLKIFFILCFFTFYVKSGYNQGDEAPFLANFATLISKSYTTPLPSVLTSSTCLTDMSYTNTTMTIPNSMTASQVQTFCGKNSRCVIPSGLTLTMDGNLIVGSLVVQGKLTWTDTTQTASDQFLCAGYIVVVGGDLTIDLNTANSAKRAFIYIKDNTATDTSLRTRVFGGYSNAKIKVSGRSMTRTWSLLATKAYQGNSSIQLMHDPASMNWRVGDRIGIAPMTTGSNGNAEVYYIKSFGSQNTIILSNDAALTTTGSLGQAFDVSMIWSKNAWTAHLQAEVVNLQRNIIITGSDFTQIPCITGADFKTQCACDTGMGRTKCTMGLQTLLSGPGSMQISYTRIEKAGQRGIMGRYPAHLHFVGNCSTCLFQGNAIEFSMQRGIVIHESHLATIQDNILWDVRGGNLYVEDGNEMYNRFLYNVAICPFDIAGPQQGCTIPGTDNGQADTALNQAGIWGVSFTNYMIGNRAANSWNGMLYQEQGFPTGRNTLSGLLCPPNQAIGRMEGCTFHGHGRFGTYVLASVYPKKTDRSLLCNGMPCNLATCAAYDNVTGADRGLASSLAYNVDYSNVFVGQYNSGDIQYNQHTSINNLNLMYWKETKNFVDRCSAHIKNSHYSGTQASGFQFPGGHGTILVENTNFANLLTLISSHHCNVGVTGVLCMPTYVFVNCTFDELTPTNQKNFIEFGANNGAMYTLSDPDCLANTKGNKLFPAGYCAIVNPYWTYLLALDGGATCITASNLAIKLGLTSGSSDYTGFINRYANAIFCKKTVRRLEIYTKGQFMASAPNVSLQLYQNNVLISSQIIPYFQIALDTDKTNKQGYSTTVIPGTDKTYKLALANGSAIPTSWSIEFSDVIFGNRWKRDEINLNVVGRTCPTPVHSQHDRKYIWYDSDHYQIQTGRGACTSFPDEPTVNCAAQPVLTQVESCPTACPTGKCGANSYCDCGTGTCICEAGFYGTNCASSTCSAAGCDATNGRCSARYLGGTLPVTQGACVCKPGSFGAKCNANPCAGRTCNGNGTCYILSETDWTCVCKDGYDGLNCQNKCLPPAQITPQTPANTYICQPPCYLGIQYYPGVDIRGTDVAASGVSTAAQCGALCKANSACNSFVYPGYCYMKSNVNSFVTLNSTVGGVKCGFKNITIYYGKFDGIPLSLPPPAAQIEVSGNSPPPSWATPGAIVGLVIAGIILILIVIVLVVRRSKDNLDHSAHQATTADEAHVPMTPVKQPPTLTSIPTPSRLDAVPLENTENQDQNTENQESVAQENPL